MHFPQPSGPAKRALSAYNVLYRLWSSSLDTIWSCRQILTFQEAHTPLLSGLQCYNDKSVGIYRKFARGVTTQAHMEGGLNGPLSGTEGMKSRTAILGATVLFSITWEMKWEQAPTLFFTTEGKMELFSPSLLARRRLLWKYLPWNLTTEATKVLTLHT